MIATKAAIAAAVFLLSGCAQLFGTGSLIAQNQVVLQNFLLLTATVATSEAAYVQTKALLQPDPKAPTALAAEKP